VVTFKCSLSLNVSIFHVYIWGWGNNEHSMLDVVNICKDLSRARTCWVEMLSIHNTYHQSKVFNNHTLLSARWIFENYTTWYKLGLWQIHNTLDIFIFIQRTNFQIKQINNLNTIEFGSPAQVCKLDPSLFT
jgi:hypothetical protein